MSDEEIINKRIWHSVYLIRGYIINETVEMERTIDFFLSKLFVKNKQFATNLRDWVFTERIPLEPKLQIFKLVIGKYKPEINKNYPKLHNELLYITEQRNIFAHYLMLQPEDEHREHFKKTGRIIMKFAKFKNDVTVITYTHEEVEYFKKLLHKNSLILLGLK